MIIAIMNSYYRNKKKREKMKKEKKVSESYTHHVQILTQANINGYKRLFGGQLMEWIDIVAAVVARRHSESNVTTVSVDNLIFKKPAFANDTITIEGFITYAGKTSMEICVRTFVENLDGSREEINTAFLVMVAIDEDGNPTKVPKLKMESEKDKINFEAAIKRKKLRKVRKNENF